MHRYRVVESEEIEGRIKLQCSDGRRHLAHSFGHMPAVGEILIGTKLHLGFCVLLGPNPGDVFRMIFESIDREAAVDQPTWTHAPERPERPARAVLRDVSEGDD